MVNKKTVNKKSKIQTHDKNAGGAWDVQYSSNYDLSLEKKHHELTSVPLKHDSHQHTSRLFTSVKTF